ncbi:hypothetical protein V5O48_006578, partial [Marasmius crinis-equi]
MPKPLTPGIFVPLPCFFDDNEELDTAQAGVRPLVSGSMGEAIHLVRDATFPGLFQELKLFFLLWQTHAERATLVRAAREALDSVGLADMPIIAGAGGFSTRETIAFAKEAAEAGADQVIVIPPGYYVGSLKEDSNAALKQFFIDVAAGSPVPVLMYNFPGVTGGIDMDSDLINDIARTAPNICGIKLTCGAVGKLTRVTALTNSPSFKETYPRKDASAPFIVLGGFVDILHPSVAGGAGGAITGVANFAPRVCIRLWELCNAEYTKETYQETQALQGLVSRADWDAAKTG